MIPKKYYKIPSNLWYEDQMSNLITTADFHRRGEIVNIGKDDQGFYFYKIRFSWGTHSIRDKDIKLNQLIGFGDPVYD